MTGMWVTVKVVSYRGAPPRTELSARFGPDGGLIGRSQDCNLALEDPDKVISRRHGEIGCDANGFYYADTSTGGTYFYGSDLVLQQNRIALGDGDRFKIGDYELVAQLEQTTADAFQPLSAFEPAPEQPFSVVPQFAEPFSDFPFGSSQEPPREPPPPTFIDQPEASPFNESFVPADAAMAPPPAQNGGLFQLSPDDLLAGLEEPPAGISAQAVEFELPDDLFGGVDPFAPAAQPPGAPPPFAKAAEAAPAVPRPAPPSEPAPPAAPFGAPPPPAIPIEPHPPARPPAEAGPSPFAPAEPVAPVPPAPPAAVSPPFAAPEPPAAPFAPAGPVPEAAHPAPPARIPRPGAAPAVVPPLPAAAPSDLLFRQFLKGAGVSVELPPAELEQAMVTVGALFREMVDGLMTVLRARAEVKSQFRVAVTTIRAANNNPLKFTADAGDAIKLLLDPRHPGFIEPRKAVQEGLSDVMNHQLAMTAGIQAALADALRRFHPSVFEKPFEEGLVFQKKAKCWEAYVRAYPELANEVLENIFGDTFAEAYERQMQILKASGSDRGPGGTR